jgi:integron integrase
MDIEKELCNQIEVKGLSRSTKKVYWHWWQAYVKYLKTSKIGSETKAERAVEIFLTFQAKQKHVSANTQNQAFSALCFIYRWVIKRPLVGVSALRSKVPDSIRDVVDQSEIVLLRPNLPPLPLLCADLIYGCGVRIGEVGRIRIKDLHFERMQIFVREGKGKKDRPVPFPESLHDRVRSQIESMRVLWRYDVENGLNGVSLPFAFGRKSPSAHLDFAWYYLFSADDYSKCPDTGHLLRHHRDMSHIGRQINQAAKKAGIAKRVTSHCLRHSNATHSLESGVPVHWVQANLGHESLETTERYLHVAKNGATSAQSPLTALLSSAGSIQAPEHPQQKQKQNNTPKLKLFVG